MAATIYRAPYMEDPLYAPYMLRPQHVSRCLILVTAHGGGVSALGDRHSEVLLTKCVTQGSV